MNDTSEHISDKMIEYFLPENSKVLFPVFRRLLNCILSYGCGVH